MMKLLGSWVYELIEVFVALHIIHISYEITLFLYSLNISMLENVVIVRNAV